MGFAACTNEVEEFGIQQTPSEAANGIELGEGFKINVAYSGVDAETRAILERNEANTGWKASWQTNDKIGAAMYSMVMSRYTAANAPKPEQIGDVTNIKNFLNDYYNSNNEYAFVEGGDGITFASQSNAMVGAYMLYYPFNEDLNKQTAFNAIPVYTSAEKATDKLTFDVENIGEEVSERIFAANVAYFEEGGTQAPEFTVKQVPNLYMVKFSIAEKLLMKLDEPLTINQILIEANGGEGVNVIYKNGTVAPKKTNPSNDDLNKIGTPKNVNKPNEEQYGLGVWNSTKKEHEYIAFNGTDETESLIVTPDYSEENEALNAEYAIDVVGEEGKTAPFYFSALPMDPNVKEVTFTIVGEVNGVQKVYSKVYNESWENWSKLKALLTGMGETVNLNVVLNSDKAADKIYTVEQFMAKYAADKDNDAQRYHFAVDLGDGLADFIVEKDVKFEGKKVTIGGIKNSTFVADNEINVIGDVIAEGGKTITFNNYVTVGGKVEANTIPVTVGTTTTNKPGVVTFKGAHATLGSAAVTKDITVNGAGSSVSAAKKIEAANFNVTNGTINFSDIANATKLTATGATVTIAKGKVTSAEATNATVTLGNGFAVDTDFTAENSTITLDANVKGAFAATNSTIAGNPTVGTMNLVGSITDKTTNIKAGTITADVNSVLNVSELTATTVDVYGVATATKVGTIGTLNVQPLAEVTLTGANAKSSYANVNVLKNETTGKFGTLNVNTKLPVEIIENNGIINANNAIIAGGENAGTITGTFTLAGEFAQKGVADGTTITVEKDAALTISANTNVAALTNNGTVNVEGKSALTFAAASNAGTINVAGTMVEGAADALTMTADAIINAQKGATLTMNSTSKKIGTVNVFNGCKELSTVTDAFKKVCFEWIGSAEPDANALAVANNIYLNGAKIATDEEVNAMQEKNKTYIFTGNCNIEKSVTIAAGKSGKNYSTVIFDGEEINITSKTAVTMTLAGLNNVVKNPSKVSLGDNITLNAAKSGWDGATSQYAKLTVENGAILYNGNATIKNLVIERK